MKKTHLIILAGIFFISTQEASALLFGTSYDCKVTGMMILPDGTLGGTEIKKVLPLKIEAWTESRAEEAAIEYFKNDVSDEYKYNEATIVAECIKS